MRKFYLEIAIGFSDYTWTSSIKEVEGDSTEQAEKIAEENVAEEYKNFILKKITFIKTLWIKKSP